MPINLMKLEVSADKPIVRKIMIYGDTGAGKTHLIGTAQDVPELAQLAAGSIDGGLNTLASRGDIVAANTRSANEVEELLWMLAKRDASVAHIHSLLLDGVSELQDADLSLIAQQAAVKKDTRNKDLNELQDFKLNKGKMERLLRMARNLDGLTLFLTCRAKKVYPKDSSGQEVKTMAPIAIKPDLTDGVAKTLQAYCDDVWYIEKLKNSDTRVLYTGEYKGIEAKTRDRAVAAELTTLKDGVALPYIVNPTFTDIYARMKKAYKLA